MQLDTPLISTGDAKLDYTINNMLIGFLSYIADKERDKIQARVIEGLNNAKAKGVKLGRTKRSVEFAKLLNISRETLYRLYII